MFLCIVTVLLLGYTVCVCVCETRPGTLVLANSKIEIEYKGKILFRTP